MRTTICRIVIGVLTLAASGVHAEDCSVASNGVLLAAELSPDLLRKAEEDPHVVACRKSREALAGNPYRPLYHMSAPDKLIHDPNGLCQWKGRYHLFYQYKMPGAGWLIHWGHAYSDDLLHWKDLPVAIKPTIEGSCFSGSTLVEKDRVIAMYHGTGRGNMIATASDPLLLDWEKHPDNPVIPIGNTQGPYAVGDPCIWKEKDGYYYTLTRGRKAREVHILRSKDLTDWKWLGPMFVDEKFAATNEDISCPYFWPIGKGKHLLLCFSHGRAGQGYLGTFDLEKARFTADYHFRANYGPWMHGSIHAPSATIDDKGRYVAIYNMKEGIGVKHEGWDGVMSLPLVYSLAKDNSLRVEPVEEVEKLRYGHKQVAARPIPAGKETPLRGIGGKAMEIKAVLNPGAAKEVGLKVLQSPDGSEYLESPNQSEYTVIRFDTEKSTLSIDTLQSSLLKIQPRPPETGPLVLAKGEPLELRIFIDRSIVEVFANGRLFLGVRVYPTKEDASGVSLFSKGGDAELVSLEAWQIRSVWPELGAKEGK